MASSALVFTLKIVVLMTIFSQALTTYDSLLAKKMVYLSSIAYEDPTTITHWSCDDCQTISVHRPIVFNSGKDLLGFIGVRESDKAIVISFRGTNDVKNCITDADTKKVDYPLCSGCAVHNGFYTAYSKLAVELMPIFQRFIATYPSYEIQITGHSLGGALAILCALDLENSYGKVAKVYTYGEPRVGEVDFVNYAQSKLSDIYRVINYQDVVPHAPPHYLGFRHEGTEEWYNPEGMQTRTECPSESDNCSNSVPDRKFTADDHHIVNYMKLKIEVYYPYSTFVESNESLRREVSQE